MPKQGIPLELFKDKIKESTTRFYNGTPCQEWQAAITKKGYGKFWYEGKWQQAHRVAFFLAGIKLSFFNDVDHLCRNRRCVNLLHLEEVTKKENCLRGNSPPAQAARQTFCKRGHEFTVENTIKRSDGGRRCRICTRKLQYAHTTLARLLKQ